MFHKLFASLKHSAVYAKYRPEPPAKLIDTLTKFLGQNKPPQNGKWPVAVDVGCGTGQCTELLQPHFERLYGFDISGTQIEEAKKKGQSNITYKVSPAEIIPLPDKSVDLITASQCFHWFKEEEFYKEADRVLTDNGVLAVFGYLLPLLYDSCGRVKDHKRFEKLVYDSYYSSSLEPYWNMDRLSVLDSGYKNIVLPYPDFARVDDLVAEKTLSLEDLCGYITTWSGYNKCQNASPETAQRVLEDFVENFKECVEGDPMSVRVRVVFKFALLLTRKPESVQYTNT